MGRQLLVNNGFRTTTIPPNSIFARDGGLSKIKKTRFSLVYALCERRGTHTSKYLLLSSDSIIQILFGYHSPEQVPDNKICSRNGYLNDQDWSAFGPASLGLNAPSSHVLYTRIRSLRRGLWTLRLWSSWLLIASKHHRNMAETFCVGGRYAGGRLHYADTARST